MPFDCYCEFHQRSETYIIKITREHKNEIILLGPNFSYSIKQTHLENSDKINDDLLNVLQKGTGSAFWRTSLIK